MAESTRKLLGEVDATIARVRERIGEPPRDDLSRETATALSIVDAWNAHLLGLSREGQLAAAARDFRAQWPALVRWRDRVLGNQRRAKPAIVAAAYESLALECTLAGELHLAAKAQQAAINVIRARGPKSSSGPKVVPIRPSATADDAQAQSA